MLGCQNKFRTFYGHNSPLRSQRCTYCIHDVVRFSPQYVVSRNENDATIGYNEPKDHVPVIF